MPIPVPTPRQALIAAGVSTRQLDRDRRAGRSVALFRGVHVDASHADGLLPRIAAAMATQSRQAVVGMQTAAVLHGLRWLPAAWSAPDAPVHVVVPQDDARRSRRGLRLHRRLVGGSDREVVCGVPCLSVARTLVELARMALPELLVVQLIDGALYDKRTTVAELLGVLERFRGERNIAIARRRILRSRAKVRSPQETRLRLLLEDAGITVDVAIEIRDECGVLVREGDLGIKKLLLWGEYDGFDEHTDRRTFSSDRFGDRWLDRRGWKVMRFSNDDFGRVARTVDDWRQAIAEAPTRIAGLDPRRSPEVAEARCALGLDPPEAA